MSAEAAVARRLDVLDAIVYADAFGCAVTLDELWRYARAPVRREELRRLLEEDPVVSPLVATRGGLYCFGDRASLLEARPERLRRAARLQRRARRVARVLRHAPFVRALLLTGSAAADDAGDDADVDLLVVVEPGRLATVFLLLGPASRLLGRRLFCPNYYVCEGALALPPGSVYRAREIAQARGLVGNAQALHAANGWLTEVFPNATAGRESPLRQGRLLQRLVEAPLRSRLGDWLERRAHRVAVARLETHYRALGHSVPEDVSAAFEAGHALRFHGGRAVDTALERYTARREELAALLADASVTPAAARS